MPADREGLLTSRVRQAAQRAREYARRLRRVVTQAKFDSATFGFGGRPSPRDFNYFGDFDDYPIRLLMAKARSPMTHELRIRTRVVTSSE